MDIKSIGALLVTSLMLEGCITDLTAVADFAKEGTLITSNEAMLDDSDAQTQARLYQKPNNFEDPDSPSFKAHITVTKKAIDALNGYMTVLAQLSSNDVANVSSDFSTIDSALTALKVTDPNVQSGLNATSALVSILLDAKVRSDVKALVVSSAKPVGDITAYLIDQAQTTSNTYNQAIAANNEYWGALTKPHAGELAFCGRYSFCATVDVLSDRAHQADISDLAAKAAAADAAVTAFKKIQADNAALAASVDSLDSKALIDTLKADEPYLLTAIKNLKSL